MKPHLTIVPPCAELAKHVLYYTLRSDVSSAVDAEHTAVFPSNLYGWLVITHRGSIRGMRSGTRLPPIALTGIQTRPARVRYGGAVESTAVIFRPGRLRAFCALPPSQLTDAIVDGAQVFGAHECAMLEQQLRDAGDPTARIAVIERFLLDRLQPSAGWKRLPEALEDVYCCLPRMSITDLGEHFSLTPRTLQRRFRGTFGVSPKVFTRITRVHVALWHLEHARRLGLDSLAHVAHRLGYSDQAHFSRDFRAMVGVTPAHTLSMLEQRERMAWAFKVPRDLIASTRHCDEHGVALPAPAHDPVSS
jgi:AraC-like DNA-binding protein